MSTNQQKQTIDIPFVIPLEVLAGMVAEKAGDFLPLQGMTLNKVQLSGQDNRLNVDLEITGAFPLIIKLYMTPDFDSDKDALLVRDFEMDTKGGSLIGQAAGWLVNTFFKGKIDDRIASVLTELYRKMKAEIMQSMDSIDLPGGVTLKGKVEDLRPSDLSTTSESIRCMLHIRGDFTIYMLNEGIPEESRKVKE